MKPSVPAAGNVELTYAVCRPVVADHADLSHLCLAGRPSTIVSQSKDQKLRSHLIDSPPLAMTEVALLGFRFVWE